MSVKGKWSEMSYLELLNYFEIITAGWNKKNTTSQVTHTDITRKKKYTFNTCMNYHEHIVGRGDRGASFTNRFGHEEKQVTCQNCRFINEYIRSYQEWSTDKREIPHTIVGRHIVERCEEISPMVFDSDLSTECGHGSEPSPLYTDTEVKRFVLLAQRILKCVLVDKCNLDCYVLEKPGYHKDIYFKNGFHLHFPHVWLTSNDRLLINRIVRQNKHRVNEAFDPDDAVVRGNWLMYGSCKDTNSGVYKVTKIYNSDCVERKCDLTFEGLVILLSVRQTHGKKINEVTEKHRAKYARPQSTHINNKDECNIDESGIEMMMTKLIPSVSDNYNSWRSIGVTLYKLTGGSDEGLKMWLNFSRMSHKYNNLECEKFWCQLKGKEIKNTVGTLIHFYKVSGGQYSDLEGYKTNKEEEEESDDGECECKDAESCTCHEESDEEESYDETEEEEKESDDDE